MVKKVIQTAPEVTDPQLLAIRGRYLSEEIANLISAPTPEGMILNRKGRGGSYDYVPTYFFVSKANCLFGYLWDVVVEREGIIEEEQEVTVDDPVQPTPDGKRPLGAKPTHTEYIKVQTQVWVEGYVSFTIPAHTLPDGTHVEAVTVRKHAYGGKDIAYYEDGSGIIDIGDDFKGAVADMMKKAFSYMGFQNDIYGRKEIEDVIKGSALSQAQIDVLVKRGQYLGGEPAQVLEKIGRMADAMFKKGLYQLNLNEYAKLSNTLRDGGMKHRATSSDVSTKATSPAGVSIAK